MFQAYSHDHLPAPTPADFTHPSPDAWFDHLPLQPSNRTPTRNTGHSNYHPSNHVGHPSTVPLPSSNDPTQSENLYTISAEDQWGASYFIHDVLSGHMDPSALFPEYWGDESTSGYHCASNTLQVEESHGMVASQPPPPLNSATGTCPILPFPQPYSPDSSRCQRRACGSQNVRYHPASVPQHLPRGTRKNWGPAATKMNLESTIAELCREGVDDEAINTVKEIFGTGFNVGALMRKMTKEESWRYLNGEKGQIYRALLRDVKERFQCRLCHEGPHAMSWKHARDVVRHLRRDHFGLGDSCAYCKHVVYTTGEMTNHRCKVI